MTSVPLRRNRDFLLLQTGQLLSAAGTQATSVAYPLLVLSITHSPAKTGFVSFVATLGWALFGLPAGLAADRYNRKLLLVAADAVRALAVGALAAAALVHRLPFWSIPVAAFVESSGAALFTAAQAGALRAVVPTHQLPAAAGVQTGRQAAVRLAGPPLGGALFGVARALPFVADAASYAFSTAAVLAIRTPFQQPREPDHSPLRARFADGMRFLWGHPFLRTCALLFGLTNFIGPGVLLSIVVIGKQQGLSGGRVGALLGAFGGLALLGSFLAPLVRRLLPIRAILVLELWTWIGCALFLVHPSVYLLLIGILPTALAIPSTDSVVNGYRIAMTPDRLLGRVEAARTTISLMVAPLGPLVAGALLATTSPRTTIAVFALAGLVLAVWGTVSPAIRSAPSLDELGTDDPARSPSSTPA